jgi:hypothetical protein
VTTPLPSQVGHRSSLDGIKTLPLRGWVKSLLRSYADAPSNNFIEGLAGIGSTHSGT